VISSLFRHVRAIKGAEDVLVLYVCGTDHAKYCGRGFNKEGQGVVVIPRANSTPHKTRVEGLVFGATSACKGVGGLSSTQVRRACESGDVIKLQQMLHEPVVEYIIQHNLFRWPVPTNRRKIFISASALARAWKEKMAEGKETELTALQDCCDTALFFFGSKRSWIFPNSKAELEESRQQGRYEPPQFPKALTELIRTKEARTPSEVYFLKPPSLQYAGFGTGCHPRDPKAPAFAGASRWLQLHGFKPLLLDREWWLSNDRGDNYASRKSLTGATAKSIVDNFEIGEHDYSPCIELLHQSNPGLVEPELSPRI